MSHLCHKVVFCTSTFCGPRESEATAAPSAPAKRLEIHPFCIFFALAPALFRFRLNERNPTDINESVDLAVNLQIGPYWICELRVTSLCEQLLHQIRFVILSCLGSGQHLFRHS